MGSVSGNIHQPSTTNHQMPTTNHTTHQARLTELEEAIKDARGGSTDLVPVIEQSGVAETVSQLAREKLVADYIASKISEHRARNS